MKIGINGRFLVAKQTGVQRVARNLIATLVDLDKENEYIIFTSEDERGKPEWQHPNVQIIASDLKIGQVFRNSIWEQVTLPRLAKKHQIDILHSPANMAPLFYNGKSILHIHDLCFVVNPTWYSFAFRTWYNFVVPLLTHKVDRVITNSNNSRNDLLLFCELPIKKVSLVYWAVGEEFLSYEKDTKLNPPFEYILYVGSLEPRKNIKTLLQAYTQLREENPDIKTKLMLVGTGNPLFKKINLSLGPFAPDIILQGFISDEVLRRYYREAKLVVYPSLYEGFGLPPLEAMASGVPVVTSNTSSLPEVVGKAALTVDPLNGRELAGAMKQGLTDELLRHRLIQLGYEQVSRFNWYRVARNVISIYYEVFHTKRNDNGHTVSIPFADWDRLYQLEENLHHKESDPHATSTR